MSATSSWGYSSACSYFAATGATFFSSQRSIESMKARSSASLMVACAFISPIVLHDLGGPGGFANLAARQEARDHRFDVQYRRAVNSIEPLDIETQAVDRDDAAHA